jgi:hypothetical protein
MTEKELEEMVGEADNDHDGLINYKGEILRIFYLFITFNVATFDLQSHNLSLQNLFKSCVTAEGSRPGQKRRKNTEANPKSRPLRPRPRRPR